MDNDKYGPLKKIKVFFLDAGARCLSKKEDNNNIYLIFKLGKRDTCVM